MTYLIFIILIYFATLALFTYYSIINVRQTKTIEEWNEKTDVEIAVLKERNVDLETRLKKLENDLNDSIIESEPEFGGKKR